MTESSINPSFMDRVPPHRVPVLPLLNNVNPTSSAVVGNEPPARHGSHIPALDGIRGLAVLLVFYCHATLINLDGSGAVGKAFMASARLSWSGVDLFFVLSGFLITGILFDSKSDQHYFRNFYARRTVRIFPLYYAFLVFALLLVPMIPALARTFDPTPGPHSKAWYWVYLSNFIQPTQASHPNDIIHVSWTLAIEEQFYLCWPLLVFLLDRRWLMRACLTGFFLSLIIRSGMVVASVPEAEVGGYTFCRLDGLLAGAWIALMIRVGNGWRPREMRELRNPAKLMGIGSAILLGAIVIGSYAAGWRGGIGQSPAYCIAGFSVLATLFASVLVLAVTAPHGSITHRIFTGRFLTTLGKYSYAYYLLHWPVTIVLRDYDFNPNFPDGVAASSKALLARQFAFYLLAGSVSLAVSFLSWHLYEKHFLALKKYFHSRHTSPTVAAATH